MPGRWNEIRLRPGHDITKWVKRRIQTAFQGGIILTARRRAEERRGKREIKNLWHHVPRMSAMSLQTTSQHIGVRVGITSRPITALEEREGLLWNAWVGEGGPSDSPMSILCLHHMTQSHKWFWNCSMLPKVSLKGKKREWEKDLKEERERERGDREKWWREKGENIRRCVLLHTSGWVTTSTEET